MGEFQYLTDTETVVRYINNVGKVYSLEYTEVPKVFSTLRHGRWR
jgi:hypothetical protein